MSKQTRLIIVHDVLGTLFSLESPTNALLKHYPDLDPKFAELIIYDWYHATQRDYTNLSINADYQPISKVFKATLARILSQSGLKPEEESPGSKSIQETCCQNLYPKVSEEIMKSLTSLTPRPGMVKAFNEIYRDPSLLPDQVQKVDLWGATNGGVELARKLFQDNLGENGRDLSHQPIANQPGKGAGLGIGIFSCDEIKVAKPSPDVYQAVKEKIGFGKDGNQVAWFVATHSWDTYAAKKAGFKTAWVSNEEHFNCFEIYGQPDIIGRDLQEVSTKILEWERNSAA